MERVAALRRQCRRDPEDMRARARLAAEQRRGGTLSQASLEAAAYYEDPAAIALVGPSAERLEFERAFEKSNRFQRRLRWLHLAAAPVLMAGAWLILDTPFACPFLSAVFAALAAYGFFAGRPRLCPSCGARSLRRFEYCFGNPAQGLSPEASNPYTCERCCAAYSRCGGRWFAHPSDELLEAYEAAVGDVWLVRGVACVPETDARETEA